MQAQADAHKHTCTQKGRCNWYSEPCRCEFRKTDARGSTPVPPSDLHELLLACQSLGQAQTHSVLAAETFSQQGSAGMPVYEKKHCECSLCAVTLFIHKAPWQACCSLIRTIQGITRSHCSHSYKIQPGRYFNFHLFMRSKQCAFSFMRSRSH